MSCIVQKFGGTSVATTDRIKRVANIIYNAKRKYRNVAVVISAMAGVTNKFIEYVNELGGFEGDSEYDAVVSSGEQITSGLVAIALKNAGMESRSYASWQVPIFTNDNYGRAVIRDVMQSNINEDFKNNIIPVICGFQGINSSRRITTLGRGGSDLTAVAVASAVNAEICEIYSDVDGVYTVDPNLYPYAKKIDRICYREMLEMSSNGAKVLQEQSVDYAMRKNVVVRVASSFVDSATGGTIISSKSSAKPFCGIAVTHNLSQIKVTYREEKNFNDLIPLFEKNFIKIELFRSDNSSKANIMVDKKRAAATINILKKSDFISSVKQEIARKHFSKISVIGSSVTEKIGLDIVSELKKHKIDSFGCLSSAYRSNLIISSSNLINAVAVLHKYCGLDK